MISPDEITKNFSIFKDKFTQYVGSVDESLLVTVQNASWEIKNDNGYAYGGSLLQVVLRTLIPTALNIAKVLPANIQPSPESIIKVLLIQHIGKAQMFVPNTNTWEVQKLNKVYTYNDATPGIKLGALSFVTAVNWGVRLSPEEFEAITITDRNEDDWQAKLHVSPLSHVVRMANEMTNVIITQLKNG